MELMWLIVCFGYCKHYVQKYICILKVFAVVIVTNISTCEYNENCVCSIPANDSYNFDNESSKLVIVR